MSEPMVFRTARRNIQNAMRTRTVDEADEHFEGSLRQLKITLEIEHAPRWRVEQFVRDMRKIYVEERAKAYPEAQSYVGPMSRSLAKLKIQGSRP